MAEFDLIVIGSGPAGLTAARRIAEAGRRVLVIERESIGGRLMKLEWVENYPTGGARILASELGAKLATEAENAGAKLELAEVEEIETYSSSRAVSLTDGRAYTADAVIVAGGLSEKKLGVAADDRLAGKGIIHCAVCDGGLYTDKVVAVAGGGDAGLIEALYLSKFASKVHIFEQAPELSADDDLQARANAEPKLEIHCNARVADILGGDGVSGVAIENAVSGERSDVDAYGVLLQVGFDPASQCLDFVAELDEQGYAVSSDDLETDVAGIYLAGDIRRDSPRSVAAAEMDGERAAEIALAFLAAAS